MPNRLEINRRKSGGIDLVCKHCKEPLHTHDKTRVYTSDSKGPAGSYHYEYQC